MCTKERAEKQGRVGAEGLTIEDYVLAAFYYAGGRLPTKIHVIKVLGAFARLTGREDFFEYAPYRMGLYSIEVDSTLNDLVYDGYVLARNGYRLTHKGMYYARRAAKKLESLSPDDAELLKQLVKVHKRLRADEVLLLHYVLFCDNKCRSVSDEWKRIQGRRAEIALKMLRRGLVSWRLAARLAGMSLDEFAKYAERGGMRVGDELLLSDIEEAKREAEALRARLKRGDNS